MTLKWMAQIPVKTGSPKLLFVQNSFWVGKGDSRQIHLWNAGLDRIHYQTNQFLIYQCVYSLDSLRGRDIFVFHFDHQSHLSKTDQLLCGLGNNCLNHYSLSESWSSFLKDWLNGLRWTLLRKCHRAFMFVCLF